MRLALTGGAYQARSVIASNQRALNLYQEPLPQQQGEPSQFASYPTPGLTLLTTLPQGPIRGIYQAWDQRLYVVAGNGVYSVNTSNLAITLLGSITGGISTPVSMIDNTLTLVIVDGTSGGWQVDLASNTFSAISDPNFSGADRVDYLDTYLLFNKPGTPQFYSSDSLAVTFDPLYFANKTSHPDLLVTLVVAKREIWLLGQRSSEIWYDTVPFTDPTSGTVTFPFSQIPSTFVDHGCVAKYSVAVHDNSVFWLARDRQGINILMKGAGYQTARVSNFAVEQAWARYGPAGTQDAIGFIYLVDGHTCYVLTFPSADHTWVYDINTGLWHEWLWIDGNGAEHRHRANCGYPVINVGYVGGDWQNGNLYLVDYAALTDNGAPIKRQRSWPHVLNEGKRIFHREFIADFETGMDGPVPSRPQTLIECLFNGPDGTLVENYSPSALELNATWTRVSGVGAELLGNAAVSLNGATVYASSGPFPPMADYSIAFRVWNEPGADDGSSALVAGRALGTGTYLSGYIGGLQIINGAWYADLGGRLMQTGNPPPSGWFDCLMTMTGPVITLIMQRSSDGLYLGNDAQWHSTMQAALALNDTTYTAAGRIMFGLNALPTGVMGTEDATGTWVLEDGSGGSWEWDEAPTDSLGLDHIVVTTIPTPWQLLLDWSDDRGHTFGTPVPQSMGGQGEYLTQAQWQRLAYSRDRVYRLTWTAPLRTSLQGAWIEAQPALS